MPTVVGVRFRESGKMYQFDPVGIGLRRLDKVVVETANGPGVGRVVVEPSDRADQDVTQPLRRVLRKATPDDLDKESQAQARAASVLECCRVRIRDAPLPVRVVDADASLDGRRVTVYYTSEQRVDLRPLVRELSAELRCRLEFRQVGPRDEAKLLDGYGPCGQRLCCSRWLTGFKPISIKMAKLQNLALNPGKLAGVCGRLKCCLRYELENYEEGQRELPGLGVTVYTTQGEGRVVGLNLPERKVQILLDDAPTWFGADEVFSHNGCQGGGGCGGACGGHGG